ERDSRAHDLRQVELSGGSDEMAKIKTGRRRGLAERRSAPSLCRCGGRGEEHDQDAARQGLTPPRSTASRSRSMERSRSVCPAAAALSRAARMYSMARARLPARACAAPSA